MFVEVPLLCRAHASHFVQCWCFHLEGFWGSEALPIFLDRLVTPYMAIILSVTMVLIFGEILPQAIFAHYRLPIGAYLSGFVWVLEVILSPVVRSVSGSDGGEVTAGEGPGPIDQPRTHVEHADVMQPDSPRPARPDRPPAV